MLLIVPLRIGFGSNISSLLAANHRKSFTISQYNSQLDMPLLMLTSASMIALRFSSCLINKKRIVSARKALRFLSKSLRSVSLNIWVKKSKNKVITVSTISHQIRHTADKSIIRGSKSGRFLCRAKRSYPENNRDINPNNPFYPFKKPPSHLPRADPHKPTPITRILIE